MKKISLSLFLIFAVAHFTLAQERDTIMNGHFNLKCGAGYFYCLPAPSDGSTIWFELSHRTNTGFNLSYKLQYAQTFMELTEDKWLLYKGQKKPDIFCMFDISASRQIKLFRSNHILEPGLGLMAYYSNTWLPTTEFYPNSETGGYYVELRDVFEAQWLFDLSISLKIDYHYQFKNGFFCGLRANGYYVLGCWLEGITLSPILGVKF